MGGHQNPTKIPSGPVQALGFSARVLSAFIGVHRRPMILVALVGCSLVQEKHIGRR